MFTSTRDCRLYTSQWSHKALVLSTVGARRVDIFCTQGESKSLPEQLAFKFATAPMEEPKKLVR